MPEIQYKLRDGFAIKGDVRAVGERIEALKRRHATPESPEGFTTPQEVFEDARDDPDSPLRPCFTFDRDQAALLRNLDEARYLLRCYEVHIVSSNREPMVISPANVTVRRRNGDNESRTFSTAAALSQDDLRKQILGDAIQFLKGAQDRLSKLRGVPPKALALIGEAHAILAKEAARKEKARRPAAGAARPD